MGAAEMPTAMVAAAAGMCVTPSVSTAMTAAMTAPALRSRIAGD